MVQKREQVIQLVAAGVTLPGSLHLLEYSGQERVKRAAIAWLVCWLLAVVSLPIVFAHWVLVPGFFFAGPFAAYRYYHTLAVPQAITGRCPQCQHDITLPVEAADKLPMWRYCPQCNQSLQLLSAQE